MIANTNRGYRLLEDLGTNPAVVYLKKVDADPLPEGTKHRYFDSSQVRSGQETRWRSVERNDPQPSPRVALATDRSCSKSSREN